MPYGDDSMKGLRTASDAAYDVDDLEYWRTRRPDDVADGFQPVGDRGPATWSCERYCPVCQHGLPLTDSYCWNCGEPA